METTSLGVLLQYCTRTQLQVSPDHIPQDSASDILILISVTSYYRTAGQRFHTTSTVSFSISWSILPSIPPEGFVRIYVALSWYFVIIPIRQAGMEPLKFQHLEIILLPANYQLVYWSVSSYVTNKSSWWLTKITSPKNSKSSPSSRKKSPGRRDYIHQPRALWHASDLPEAAQVKSDDSNCSSFTNRWFWQKFSSVDVGVCFFGVDQDFSN